LQQQTAHCWDFSYHYLTSLTGHPTLSLFQKITHWDNSPSYLHGLYDLLSYSQHCQSIEKTPLRESLTENAPSDSFLTGRTLPPYAGSATLVPVHRI